MFDLFYSQLFNQNVSRALFALSALQCAYERENQTVLTWTECVKRLVLAMCPVATVVRVIKGFSHIYI